MDSMNDNPHPHRGESSGREHPPCPRQSPPPRPLSLPTPHPRHPSPVETLDHRRNFEYSKCTYEKDMLDNGGDLRYLTPKSNRSSNIPSGQRKQTPSFSSQPASAGNHDSQRSSSSASPSQRSNPGTWSQHEKRQRQTRKRVESQTITEYGERTACNYRSSEEIVTSQAGGNRHRRDPSVGGHRHQKSEVYLTSSRPSASLPPSQPVEHYHQPIKRMRFTASIQSKLSWLSSRARVFIHRE